MSANPLSPKPSDIVHHHFLKFIEEHKYDLSKKDMALVEWLELSILTELQQYEAPNEQAAAVWGQMDIFELLGE